MPLGAFNLGVTHFDLPNNYDPIPGAVEEAMQALADIVHQVKALYVGDSDYPAELTEQAYNVLASMGVKLTVHQPRYNMLDRWIEDRLTDILLRKGIGAVAFSPPDARTACRMISQWHARRFPCSRGKPIPERAEPDAGQAERRVQAQ